MSEISPTDGLRMFRDLQAENASLEIRLASNDWAFWSSARIKSISNNSIVFRLESGEFVIRISEQGEGANWQCLDTGAMDNSKYSRNFEFEVQSGVRMRVSERILS